MPTPSTLCRMFLVEDIALIREQLILAVEEVASAKVVAFAEDEAGAVAWLTANRSGWDLAAVDLFLKQGSGLGVLKACASRAATQRVVVMTNYATPAIRERCLAAGADAVFDKSTELDAFLQFCAAHGDPPP